MTDEKPKSKQEQMRIVVKNTLENKLFQDIVGSNTVKNDPMLYGTYGLNGGNTTYDTSMKSDDVNKIRAQLYDERRKQGDQFGVAGEPNYPSNYDVSLNVMKDVEETMAVASLGMLEESVKTVATELDFSVPESLRGMSQVKLMRKAINKEGKIDYKRLSDEEVDGLNSFNILREAYIRIAAKNASDTNYLADLESKGKKIMDKYTSRNSQ